MATDHYYFLLFSFFFFFFLYFFLLWVGGVGEGQYCAFVLCGNTGDQYKIKDIPQ